MKPLMLDLFCCAGGMAMGYHRAGFEVVGVDINPQPNYPFAFIQADALTVLEVLLGRGRRMFNDAWIPLIREARVVHASPPCQARSDLQKQSKIDYEEFVPRTRELLKATGLPYVIENVEGVAATHDAQLIDPVMLCGTMFPGLRVLRHRLFETNWPLTQPDHPTPHPLVFTYDKRKAHFGKLDQNTSFVQVTGGGQLHRGEQGQCHGY